MSERTQRYLALLSLPFVAAYLLSVIIFGLFGMAFAMVREFPCYALGRHKAGLNANECRRCGIDLTDRSHLCPRK